LLIQGFLEHGSTPKGIRWINGKMGHSNPGDGERQAVKLLL
jgi:hypothetical protein